MHMNQLTCPPPSCAGLGTNLRVQQAQVNRVGRRASQTVLPPIAASSAKLLEGTKKIAIAGQTEPSAEILANWKGRAVLGIMQPSNQAFLACDLWPTKAQASR